MVAWLRRFVLTGMAAVFGYAMGLLGVAIGHIPPTQQDYTFLTERTPLPHHVPEHPGGLSFRFAMVQDVIHERFAKHGRAFYQERDRLARAKLAALAADDPARFALTDDLGAGLERLGRSAEAASVMRAKLEGQLKQGMTGRDLYTSYANLGTFLIHASLPRAIAGDQDAKAQFREGIEFVRKSVEVNPAAHFGRERWQVVIAEYLLAALDDPGLLKTFDCLGNRLDLEGESNFDWESSWYSTGYGRSADVNFSRGEHTLDVPEFSRPGLPLDDPTRWPKLSPIRRYITKVGAEEGWDAVPVPSHRAPVAFDEPALGMIGMWRQGGGANPYFALALGETMRRVGQRYLAWSAYERAERLASRYWPDPELQQFLRDHCRKRQAEIEKTLPALPSASTTTSTVPTTVKGDGAPSANGMGEHLRSRFNAELKFGEDYQRRYQQYEESQISAGTSIEEEHFWDGFRPGPIAIASPVGAEEWFVGVSRAKISSYVSQLEHAWGVFGAGLAAMVTALLLRRRARGRGEERLAADFPAPVPGSATIGSRQSSP